MVSRDVKSASSKTAIALARSLLMPLVGDRTPVH